MAEVQERWNASAAPEAQEDFVTFDHKGRPAKCFYTPHGMRVAGLTLMLEAGLPLEMVSKLVMGHASIVMTLHYFRPNAEGLSAQFDAALARASEKKSSKLSQHLSRISFETAAKTTLADSEELLAEIMKTDPDFWIDTDLGMCPFKGQACGNGGPLLRKNGKGKKDKFGPVEGGTGNCLLCRHFVTSTDHSTAIQAHATLIARRLSLLSKRILHLQEIERDLRKRLLEVREVETETEMQGELRKTIEQINELVLKQSPLSKTFIKAQFIIDSLDALRRMHDEDEDTSILLASDADYPLWLESSELEQTSMIVDASRVFRSIHDPEAEASRELLVMNLALQAGYSEVRLRSRSEAQRQQDIDQACKRLLSTFTSPQLIAVERGAMTLEDLCPDEQARQAIFSSGFERIGSKPNSFLLELHDA